MIATDAPWPGLGRHDLLLETSTPELAEDHLSHVFTRHRLSLGRQRRSLHFVHYHVGLGGLAVNHLAYGADVTISTPALPDFYLLQLTLKGVCRISDRQQSVDLPAGAVFVMNPGRAYRKEWSEDSAQVIVRIDRGALERRLAANGADAARLPFAFDRLEPAAATSIVRAIDFLCSDLRDPAGRLRADGPREGFTDLLLSLLADRMLGAAGQQPARPVSPAAPYYVRRAEDYIRAHADRDISLAEVATAAGVNCRTLNAGFRRFRDTTPMTFLRDVRLDRARELLGRGNDELSVTDVALACNFNHLGRFAQRYLQRFGERPSSTLRLSQPGHRRH